MSENKEKKIIIQVSTVIGDETSKLNRYINSCIEKNGIPAELMICALKNVLLNLTEKEMEKMSESLINAQTQIAAMREEQKSEE